MTDDGKLPPAVSWTPKEIAAVRETDLFLIRTAVQRKFWTTFESLRDRLRERIREEKWIVPEMIDRERGQIAKGENHQSLPFVYLDFPKCFARGETCTYRVFFWWGHYVVFALLLAGTHLPHYKRRFLDNGSPLWKGGYHLATADTLWDWERGAGHAIELIAPNRADVAHHIDTAAHVKIERFVNLDPGLFTGERLVIEGLNSFDDLAFVLRA